MFSNEICKTETDMNLRRKGKIKKTNLPKESALTPQADDKIWISDYAEHPISSKNTDYIETWAECVAAYVNEPVWFKQNYRKTYAYIDKMFKKYEGVQNNTLWSKLKRVIQR